MSDLDALVTRAASIHRVYKLGSVPASPPYPYAVLGLDSGTPENRSANGAPRMAHRLTAQFFGRDSDSVLALAALADQAFDAVTLDDLDGSPFCERELSTPPYRDPDDQGVLSILHTYRY